MVAGDAQPSGPNSYPGLHRRDCIDGCVMRYFNSVYIGGPPLDPPDDEPIIHCKFCKKKSPRTEWVSNHWHCPGCHEEDASGVIEED